MVEYICEKCGFCFKQKTDYIRHINRKKSCVDANIYHKKIMEKETDIKSLEEKIIEKDKEIKSLTEKIKELEDLNKSIQTCMIELISSNRSKRISNKIK